MLRIVLAFLLCQEGFSDEGFRFGDSFCMGDELRHGPATVSTFVLFGEYDLLFHAVQHLLDGFHFVVEGDTPVESFELQGGVDPFGSWAIVEGAPTFLVSLIDDTLHLDVGTVLAEGVAVFGVTMRVMVAGDFGAVGESAQPAFSDSTLGHSCELCDGVCVVRSTFLVSIVVDVEGDFWIPFVFGDKLVGGAGAHAEYPREGLVKSIDDDGVLVPIICILEIEMHAPSARIECFTQSLVAFINVIRFINPAFTKIDELRCIVMVIAIDQLDSFD